MKFTLLDVPNGTVMLFVSLLSLFILFIIIVIHKDRTKKELLRDLNKLTHHMFHSTTRTEFLYWRDEISKTLDNIYIHLPKKQFDLISKEIEIIAEYKFSTLIKKTGDE